MVRRRTTFAAPDSPKRNSTANVAAVGTWLSPLLRDSSENAIHRTTLRGRMIMEYTTGYLNAEIEEKRKNIRWKATRLIHGSLFSEDL